MWAARLRRQAQRRAQRRTAGTRAARRGPADASDWMRAQLRDVEMTVAAPDPSLRKFWRRAEAGEWEADTLAYLDAALTAAGPSPLFVDVGAWIGPTTLFAAGKGARVVSLEPDPAARAELLDNLAANPELAERVTVVAAALDHGGKPLALYPHSKRFGASKTSSLPDASGISVVAPTLNADALAARARRAGTWSGAVVKVDIEGHEFSVGAEIGRLIRTLGAAALISTHPRSAFDAARDGAVAEGAQGGPHQSAYSAMRGLIGALRAVGVAPRPLDRPDADPIRFAGTQVFCRGPRPKNFDLTAPAAAAWEKIRD